jgi:hypothetical protein
MFESPHVECKMHTSLGVYIAFAWASSLITVRVAYKLLLQALDVLSVDLGALGELADGRNLKDLNIKHTCNG